MRFSFTEQQEAIRDSVARLAANRLAPYYRKREQDGRIERSTALLLGELARMFHTPVKTAPMLLIFA